MHANKMFDRVPLLCTTYFSAPSAHKVKKEIFSIRFIPSSELFRIDVHAIQQLLLENSVKLLHSCIRINTVYAKEQISCIPGLTHLWHWKSSSACFRPRFWIWLYIVVKEAWTHVYRSVCRRCDLTDGHNIIENPEYFEDALVISQNEWSYLVNDTGNHISKLPECLCIRALLICSCQSL